MKRMIATLLIALVAVLVVAGTAVFSTGYAQTQTRTPTAAPTTRATTTPAAVDSTPRTIAVTGVGRITVAPDQASIRLGVQTEAETAVDALTENDTQMQAVLTALQRANIPRTDIQTRSLMLFPRYESPDPQSTTVELVGYTVTNTVEVRARELDNLGPLLDAAVRAGANIIENVQFQAGDAADQLDRAHQAAMEDARTKAARLATLAGGELGAVLKVEQFGVQSPIPFAADRLGAGGAQVAVEPGTLTIEVMLQVTWSLR
jgi:uncharacterized protein YggE